jgi:hypothetical protein
MKTSSDTIGNRTHNLLVCSAVSQPTEPPRALFFYLANPNPQVKEMFFEWEADNTRTE